MAGPADGVFLGYNLDDLQANDITCKPYRMVSVGMSAGDIVAGPHGSAWTCSNTGPKYGRVQAYNGFSTDGFIVSGGAPTGLTYDSIRDAFWVGSFTDGKIYRVSKAGVQQAVITPSASSEIQGVSHKASNDTLYFTEINAKKVRHYSIAGADLGDGWTLSYNPDHCGYDSGRDALWVVENGTSNVRRYACSDGSLQATVVCDPTPYSTDGVFYDVADDTLWINCDESEPDTLLPVVRQYNLSGSLIGTRLAMRNQEGITKDTTTGLFWLCSDDLYHDSKLGGNKILNPITDLPIYPKYGFTIACWVKPSVNNMTNNGIMARRYIDASGGGFGGSSDVGSFQFNIVAAQKLFFRIYIGGVDTGITGSTAISDTSLWYHVAAVYDGAKIRLFVNGVNDATAVTATGAVDDFGQDLWLGAYYDAAHCFEGLIAQPIVYARPLIASELAALMNGFPYSRRRGVLSIGL
jgi:hypothetical protein